MMRPKLRLSIVALMVGSFAGCSTASHKLSRSGSGITENRLTAGADSSGELAKAKPSACIKWSSDSERARKKSRRVDKPTAEPRTEALSRKNKVQAED